MSHRGSYEVTLTVGVNVTLRSVGESSGKMEPARCSETSVNFSQITHHNIPEEHISLMGYLIIIIIIIIIVHFDLPHSS